ncbi:MAG: helix-turn-helix domain-containing protein [Anaerovorax sp.]
MDHFEFCGDGSQEYAKEALHMEEGMTAFSHVSKVPVTYFDTEGKPFWSCASKEKICSLFTSNDRCHPMCTKTLVSAANTAAQLGEPYIFLCPLRLVLISFALIIDGKKRGCFFVGPLAMGSNRDSVLRGLTKKISFNPDDYAQLTVFLSHLKMFTTTDVTHISTVFHKVILASFIQNKDYAAINERYKEQAQISLNIQRQKEETGCASYPYELETAIINGVKKGETEEVKEKVLLFLDQIFVLEEGNLAFVKIRVLGLCSILARTVSSDYVNLKASFYYLENMEKLNGVTTFQCLVNISIRIICDFTKVVSVAIYRGYSPFIGKAIGCVSKNYNKKINLTWVAQKIHVNASYLSTLFKKEMGISFTNYLCQLRLEHSEELLKDTNLSVTDIALYVGFEGQSYFTKMFKVRNGITPGQYRKKSQ